MKWLKIQDTRGVVRYVQISNISHITCRDTSAEVYLVHNKNPIQIDKDVARDLLDSLDGVIYLSANKVSRP